MALDSLLGSSPSVIFYPKTWNSTIETSVSDPFKNIVRNSLSVGSLVSTAIYASQCANIFEENSPFLLSRQLPTYLVPLIIVSLAIQYIASFVETKIARQKGML
jgi:hypothetical protein